MLDRTLRVGTRKSPLALKQADEVIWRLKGFYPEIAVSIIGIDTYGDRDKVTPISDIEGTDFFTREIEEALLNGRVDFAVHSAKDMPDQIPGGLCVAAITRPIDNSDALVSRYNLRIDKLRTGARIGASSRRRKMQLKSYREDFQLVDIRGSIGERLRKMDDENLDAVVVASCALMRLGLEKQIAQRIPADILKPHPLQGALAIEVRRDDRKLRDVLGVLDGR
jgi:hydroxymethylbilane synthase